MNDYVLIDVLSNELSGDDLLIPGSSGACSERTMQAVRVKTGLRVFNSEGTRPHGIRYPRSHRGLVSPAAGGGRFASMVTAVSP